MRPLTPRIANSIILVVDDIDFNRRIMIDVLEKAGYNNIETAHDGAQALEKTLALTPDLVLLDLMMPGLDGYGYCEAIRKDERFALMPIIVQTVLDGREHKLRALSCGADDFLHKPFDQDEMVLRVRIHLERLALLRDVQHLHKCLNSWSQQNPDVKNGTV